MQNQIEVVFRAIASGRLSMDDAVAYTQALANESWGVIAQLAHAVNKIAQLG